MENPKESGISFTEDGLDEYGVWVKSGVDSAPENTETELLYEERDSETEKSPLPRQENPVFDDYIELSEPNRGSKPLGEKLSKGRDAALMSEQEKNNEMLSDDTQEVDLSLDTAEEISLSVSDDLDDLSDLLLNLDEEPENDETIYLEDDDLSLDLESDTSDVLLDQEENATNLDDDLDDDIVIPGLEGDVNEEQAQNNLGTLETGLDPLGEPDDELSMKMAPVELHNIEEVNLEDIDDDVSSIPETAPSEFNASISEEEELSLLSLHEEELEDPLNLNDDLDINLDEESLDDAINLDLDDENEVLSLEEEEPRVQDVEASVQESGEKEDDFEVQIGNFDDVAAFTDDLAQDQASEKDERPPVPEKAADEEGEATSATGILRSIEEELHAIRSELTDLRSELKKLRSKDTLSEDLIPEEDKGDDLILPPQDNVLSPEEEEILASDGPHPVNPDEENAAGGGFFDDDEDETIALTGDELDNILNSAEFTEEAGEPTQIDGEEKAGSAEEDDLFFDSSAPHEDSLKGQDSEEETSSEKDTAVAGSDALEPLSFEESKTDETFAPIEEISLQEIEEDTYKTESLEESEVSFDTSALETESKEEKSELPDGNETEVENLAQMDIEKELAGIEDLKDDEEDIELYTGNDADTIEIDIPENLSQELDLETDSFTEGITAPDNSDDALEEVKPSETGQEGSEISYSLKQEIKAVLSYMDQLLESLPEEKIQEFARSEHFDVYKKLFEELGL